MKRATVASICMSRVRASAIGSPATAQEATATGLFTAMDPSASTSGQGSRLLSSRLCSTFASRARRGPIHRGVPVHRQVRPGPRPQVNAWAQFSPWTDRRDRASSGRDRASSAPQARARSSSPSASGPSESSTRKLSVPITSYPRRRRRLAIPREATPVTRATGPAGCRTPQPGRSRVAAGLEARSVGQAPPWPPTLRELRRPR